MIIQYMILLLMLSHTIIPMDYGLITVQSYALKRKTLEEKQQKIQKKLDHNNGDENLQKEFSNIKLQLFAVDYEELTKNNQLPRNTLTIERYNKLINELQSIASAHKKTVQAYKKVLTAELYSTLLFEALRKKQSLSPEFIDSCNLEARDEHNNTLLHSAVQQQNVAAVTMILNIIKGSQQSAEQFNETAYENFMKELSGECEASSENIINTPNDTGETPYQIAAYNNSVAIMQLLKDNGADTTVTKEINSIYQPAESYSNANTERKLPTTKKKKKKTAVEKTVTPKNSSVQNIISKNVVPISQEELKTLMSCVDNATSLKEERNADYTLFSKAPVSIQSLHTYITGKKPKQFGEYLTKMEKAHFMLSPLYATYLLREACAQDDRISAITLLEKGATPNFSKNGTALSYAIINNNKGLVQLLIDSGADIKHQNIKGDTPLHQILNQHNHHDPNTIAIIEILLLKKAPINVENNEHLTPLDLALEQANKCGNQESLQLFIKTCNQMGQKILNQIREEYEFGISLMQNTSNTTNQQSKCTKKDHQRQFILH